MSNFTQGLSTAQQHQFGKSLSRFGIKYDDIKGRTLSAPDGHPIRLDSDGGESMMQPKIMTTNDLDEIKSWVGNSDEVSRHLMQTCSSPYEFSLGSPTDAHGHPDKHYLQKAAFDYVFHGGATGGKDKIDAGLKREIEKTFGSFKAAVFAAENIVVKPGSPLVVTGSTPVALNYAEMDIYTGGQILIYAPGSMTIQVLKKKT